jgi:hypothetical protein
MPQRTLQILVATFAFCTFLTLPMAAQNDLKIGEWRAFQPYHLGRSVTQSAEAVFYATGLSVLSIDKSDFAIERFDKVTGLSDVGAELVRYNAATKSLLVIYENTNIDIFDPETNRVTNLPDIKNNVSIVGDRSVYDISFKGDTAVLACGFGVVLLNLRRGEFISTTFTQQSVTSVASFENVFYAATSSGIYKAFFSAQRNIGDFANWKKLGAAEGLRPQYVSRQLKVFNNKLFFDLNDSLMVFEQNRPKLVKYVSGSSVNFMSAEGKSLVACFSCNPLCGSQIFMFDPNLNTRLAPRNCADLPYYAVEDERGRIWEGDEYLYYRFQTAPTDATCQIKEFNAPFSRFSSDIAVSDSLVVFASGGVTLSGNPLNRPFGFSTYKAGIWANHSYLSKNRTILESRVFEDAYRVAINPANGHAFLGSFARGMVEMNGDEVVKVFTPANSTLRAGVADASRVRVSGLVFDKKGNLWVANNNANEPLSVLKPDGKWQTVGNLQDFTNIFQLIIDPSGNKWGLLIGSKTGAIIFNEGKSLDDATDDKFRFVDNANLPKELESARINCLVPDLDGKVWVGTNNGIAVFECGGDPFRTNCNARVVISSLDGIGEYLLKDKNVQAIAVDGANRKWFGTTAGIFVQSDDGKIEVAKFNVENSPLLSNNITTLTIRQSTGEVFIGTDKGLMVLKMDATEGGEFHKTNVEVYPNPIRPDYAGPIAMKGFARDSNIKITDVNGHIVFETRALGGQAIWNGQDFSGKRVPTGVYFVLATSTENIDAATGVAAKILFVR